MWGFGGKWEREGEGEGEGEGGRDSGIVNREGSLSGEIEFTKSSQIFPKVCGVDCKNESGKSKSTVVSNKKHKSTK
jgi:hypothetical protein